MSVQLIAAALLKKRGYSKKPSKLYGPGKVWLVTNKLAAGLVSHFVISGRLYRGGDCFGEAPPALATAKVVQKVGGSIVC